MPQDMKGEDVYCVYELCVEGGQTASSLTKERKRGSHGAMHSPRRRNLSASRGGVPLRENLMN